MAVTTKQSEEEQKPEFLEGKPNSRERMLTAMEKITPISQETADMINNAVMEAREQSIGDNLTPSAKQETLSRRERVLALRAKLKPISQEDADMINKVIMESREASIARDLSA